MVLTAIVSNSAGLLTLVGDPATFLVGSSIGMTFVQYLQQGEPCRAAGGAGDHSAAAALMPEVWNARVDGALPMREASRRSSGRALRCWRWRLLALMVVLFLFGEDLPIAHRAAGGGDHRGHAGAARGLRRPEWSRWTTCSAPSTGRRWCSSAAIFCLVQAFTKTGLLQGLVAQAVRLVRRLSSRWWRSRCSPASALLSSLLANIPVVAASLVMTKGYLVAAEAVPETALGRRLHRLARRHDSGVHRHDVRRDAGRQRHRDRRFSQHRERRHLRAQRETRSRSPAGCAMACRSRPVSLRRPHSTSWPFSTSCVNHA